MAGFNSWNYAHCNIDENLVKATADAFLANGMADAGYTYINIDDCASSAHQTRDTHLLPSRPAVC